MEGVPLSLGASFRDNGYAAATLLMRILHGESPAALPFQTSATPRLEVNLPAARDFGLTLPDALVARAHVVITDSTTTTTAAPSAASDSAPAPSTFWISAIVLGLAFGALAWGVYLTSTTLRFPDITPDGSFPLGAAVAATLIASEVNPFLATIAALGIAGCSGLVTAVLHTRFKINELLAGILVMTALYSVNLRVMGRSNVSLLDRPSVATEFAARLPIAAQWSADVTFGVVFLVLVIAIGAGLAWFLRTDYGMALRAAGDNPAMVAAQGIDHHRMVHLGLFVANGLAGLSGALVAQYQGFADVSMGVGSLVAGMASVILGATLRPARWGLLATIAMVAIGAIVFRLITAAALRIGLNPVDLKLATATFVVLTMTLPRLRPARRLRGIAR
jgi:putative ABC transport system permease protein